MGRTVANIFLMTVSANISVMWLICDTKWDHTEINYPDIFGLQIGNIIFRFHILHIDYVSSYTVQRYPLIKICYGKNVYVNYLRKQWFHITKKIFALILIFMTCIFPYFISTFNGIIRCFKIYILCIFFHVEKIKSLKPIPGITNADVIDWISRKNCQKTTTSRWRLTEFIL